jgi:hypothetical protein
MREQQVQAKTAGEVEPRHGLLRDLNAKNAKR